MFAWFGVCILLSVMVALVWCFVLIVLVGWVLLLLVHVRVSWFDWLVFLDSLIGVGFGVGG